MRVRASPPKRKLRTVGANRQRDGTYVESCSGLRLLPSLLGAVQSAVGSCCPRRARAPINRPWKWKIPFTITNALTFPVRPSQRSRPRAASLFAKGLQSAYSLRGMDGGRGFFYAQILVMTNRALKPENCWICGKPLFPTEARPDEFGFVAHRSHDPERNR